MQERASVVVIGGGAIGVAVAYELAAAGVPGVVLIDSGPLGGGSTSKAAGGVRAQFSDQVNIELAIRSLETFEHFAQRLGQDIDLRQPGYLFLLDNPRDVAGFDDGTGLLRALGVEARMLEVAEARRMSPLIATEGLLAGAYSPSGGYCAPESVVLGYATAARRLGARLIPHRAATGIVTKGRPSRPPRSSARPGPGRPALRSGPGWTCRSPRCAGRSWSPSP
jgi:sarcosine oxidase, subunit beta